MNLKVSEISPYHAIVFAIWPLGNLLLSYYSRYYFTEFYVESVLAISLVLPIPILLYIRRKKNIRMQIPLSVALKLLFVTWFLFSITSVSKSISFTFSLITTLSFFVSYMYICLLSEVDILRGLGIFAFFSSIFMAYWGITGTENILHFESRNAGINIFNPNALGFFAMTFGCFSVAIKRSLLRLVPLVICFTFLYATSSRSSMLGVIVFYCANYIYSFKNPKKRIVYIIIGILLFIVVLMFYNVFINSVYEVFVLDHPARGIGSGGTGRIDQWKDSTIYIIKYCLFGSGFRTCNKEMIGYSTDNGYITYLVEMGFIGSSLALIVIIKSVKVSLLFLKDDLNRLLFFFSLAYLVHSVFERFIFNIGNPGSLLFIFWIMNSCILDIKNKGSFQLKRFYENIEYNTMCKSRGNGKIEFASIANITE